MYIGNNHRGTPVHVDADDLLTHGVVLGRTGSGKSGLTTVLIEEVVRSGAHAVVFDPKGDLTNLALSLTTPQQFKEWVEDGIDHRQAFETHCRSLAHFGLSLADVEQLRATTDVVVYAPGRTTGGGRSLNVFPTFAPPRTSDESTRRVQATRGVATVFRALHEGEDSYDPALIFMTEAVTQAWARGESLPVSHWPGVLNNPPSALRSFGGMHLEEFFPKRNRTKLARTLIGFYHQSDRWLSGETLDLHKMTSLQRPQISVFSMRHLSEEDRLFFTSIMMQRLVEFMFETSSSKKLKLLVVLDEARGYLPPHPYNPPTKDPICTILAQGRAQGIGMLIGTQNPMDLDYKALSNVGTWFVGRLRERDCARDLLSELNGRGVDIQTLEDMPQRRFLALDKRGNHHMLNVRWCLNYLRGPLDGADLDRLDNSGLVLPVVKRGRLISPQVASHVAAVPIATTARGFVRVLQVGNKLLR